MEGLTHIRLPTLPCSFPVPALHPLYERLEEEIGGFCRRYASKSTADDQKVLDFIMAEKWPFLACVMWPTALDTKLPWVAKFLWWFCLLDTEADKSDSLGADGKKTASLMGKYIEIVGQAQGAEDVSAADDTVGPANESDDMFLSCFASLWEHFRRNMTRTEYARLSSRCSTLFTLTAQQSKLREEGGVLSPMELLDLRRHVSSGMTLVTLMEYAIGVELDERILNQPEIQEMELVCLNHMVAANDILSFRKEYLDRDFSNLPSAFCLSTGVDVQTAVDLSSELMRDADRRFCELHAAVSSATYFTPQLKLFIDGLGYMMSGHLEWSWHTARCHGLGWVAPPADDPKARQGIMYLENPPRFESAALA